MDIILLVLVIFVLRVFGTSLTVTDLVRVPKRVFDFHENLHKEFFSRKDLIIERLLTPEADHLMEPLKETAAKAISKLLLSFTTADVEGILASNNQRIIRFFLVYQMPLYYRTWGKINWSDMSLDLVAAFPIEMMSETVLRTMEVDQVVLCINEKSKRTILSSVQNVVECMPASFYQNQTLLENAYAWTNFSPFHLANSIFPKSAVDAINYKLKMVLEFVFSFNRLSLYLDSTLPLTAEDGNLVDFLCRSYWLMAQSFFHRMIVLNSLNLELAQYVSDKMRALRVLIKDRLVRFPDDNAHFSLVLGSFAHLFSPTVFNFLEVEHLESEAFRALLVGLFSDGHSLQWTLANAQTAMANFFPELADGQLSYGKLTFGSKCNYLMYLNLIIYDGLEIHETNQMVNEFTLAVQSEAIPTEFLFKKWPISMISNLIKLHPSSMSLFTIFVAMNFGHRNFIMIEIKEFFKQESFQILVSQNVAKVSGDLMGLYLVIFAPGFCNAEDVANRQIINSVGELTLLMDSNPDRTAPQTSDSLPLQPFSFEPLNMNCFFPPLRSANYYSKFVSCVVPSLFINPEVLDNPASYIAFVFKKHSHSNTRTQRYLKNGLLKKQPKRVPHVEQENHTAADLPGLMFPTKTIKKSGITVHKAKSPEFEKFKSELSKFSVNLDKAAMPQDVEDPVEFKFIYAVLEGISAMMMNPAAEMIFRSELSTALGDGLQRDSLSTFGRLVSSPALHTLVAPNDLDGFVPVPFLCPKVMAFLGAWMAICLKHMVPLEFNFAPMFRKFLFYSPIDVDMLISSAYPDLFSRIDWYFAYEDQFREACPLPLVFGNHRMFDLPVPYSAPTSPFSLDSSFSEFENRMKGTSRRLSMGPKISRSSYLELVRFEIRRNWEHGRFEFQRHFRLFFKPAFQPLIKHQLVDHFLATAPVDKHEILSLISCSNALSCPSIVDDLAGQNPATIGPEDLMKRIISRFNNSQLSQFIWFFTGSSKRPLDGFKAMGISFTADYDLSKSIFSKAHTCGRSFVLKVDRSSAVITEQNFIQSMFLASGFVDKE